ncbi:MAG: methyltransferase domain-containing protein [Nitrospirae bacterium]|nr:methyltransferase domain-containing protein [Nitrospirota bacterium]
MATGKEIEKRGHIVGFKEEITKAAASSDDDFFTWFDSAMDKDSAFAKGHRDFMLHIADPSSQFISDTKDKTALEIGHGGGRILAAASSHFRNVIGVDIHEHNQKVENELKKRGVSNFRLIKTDGNEIPLEDASVDLVYSFIVLQHVEKIEIFEKYLKETRRVLKPGGVAVIYFGRKKMLSANKSSKALYFIDRISEHLIMPKGFKELPAKVNVTNLIVTLAYAKSLAKKTGFEILDELVSYKEGPDGRKLFGGQNGLVLRKTA